MATTKLGLIFEIAAHPEKAIEAMRQFQDASGKSMASVTAHMKKTESASKEFTNFIDSHLIFSVDEFIRLGRDARDAAKSSAEVGEWNGELDKTQSRIERISEEIELKRQEAHQKLGEQLMKGTPQDSQAKVLGAQMSGLNNVMLQSAMAAMPAITCETEAVENFKAVLLGAQGALLQFAQHHQFAAQMSDKFGEAMGKNVAQTIVYSASITQAMERALKATIESIAAKALVQVIYSTALGFLLLAEFDFPAAVQAFEAAAMFGAVGGAAASIGAAIPGAGTRSRGAPGSGAYGAAGATYSSRGGERGGEARENAYGGAGSLAPAQAYQAPVGGGNLTVAIMGDEEAGNWLATTLNRATTQQGVQLIASSSQRGAPVGH